MSKAKIAAYKTLRECGIEDVTEIPLDLLVAGCGATLLETPLKNADGRIVHGKYRSIIKINSNIRYKGRKRFAIAHELGHFKLHRNALIHNDSKSLNWFGEAIKKMKAGKQELEANEFAVELLMPRNLFIKEAKNKRFSPDLLRSLANRFQTSITSVAFRYAECNLHPICLFHTSDGEVKYYKKSDDWKAYIPKYITKNPPPSDSVAMEYIQEGYKPIYYKEESTQEIFKSTWFKKREDERNTTFYEYCIVTTNHKTILSVVWEG